jgi:hypothetical protein
VYDNGTNIGIGTTTPGYKLDVNGTTRSQGKLTITTGGAEITGNVVAYTGIQSYGQVQIFSAAAFQMFNAANNSKASFQYINANGLLLTTNSDNISGVLKGLQVNPTMVAAANNDVLVGLDISPTFTVGAFTGVTTLGLRVQSGVSSFGGNVIMNGNNFYLGGNFGNTVIRTISTTNVQIFNNNAGATLFLNANGSVQIGQSSATNWALFSASGHTIYNTTNTYFFSTGNVGINQSSDAGYKLDIGGTTRFQGNIAQSSGTATFANGIILDSTSRIFSGGTTTYQSNSGTSQHLFKNDISNGLSGTIVTISNGSGTFGPTNASNFLNITGRLATISGTNNLTSILLNHTVENTGTYTGTIRGIYYNPSSIVGTGFTHRAIETTTGDVLFGTTSGVVGIGTTTIGTEANLYLGAKSTTEGGQLILQKGTSQTYATHLDNYSDQFRVMYGTDTGSSGIALAVSMSTRQLILPAYTTTSSFSGTVVGYLAFDSSGNILTVTAPSGAVTSVNAGTGVSVSSTTGNITVSIGQSVATSATPSFDQVFATNNGNGTNFKVGDDAWIGDVNTADTLMVMGQQNAANGYIIFGNSNFTALGRSGTGALTYGGYTIYHSNNSNTITALGTITTGVWNGTAIIDTYISSASTWNAKQNALTLTTTGTSGAATLIGATLNIPQYQSVLTNPVTGTGTAGQVAYWTGSTTQTGSNELFFDTTNNRLGVGTTTPNKKLEVYKSGLTDGTSDGIRISVQHLSANAQAALEFYHTYGSTALSKIATDIGAGGLSPSMYFIHNSITAIKIANTGNVLINTTTDGGYKLDVNGTAVVRNTLYVGTTFTGLTFSGADCNIFNNGGSAGNISFSLGGNKYLNIDQITGSSSGFTSGTYNTFLTARTYAWSSGTAVSNVFSITPSINNTGTYTGTFRGFYYNPTLTSLTGTTHRAIETVTGDIYFGSSSGKVGMGIAPSATDMLSLGGNINLGAHKLYNGAASDSAGLWFNSNVTNISGYSGISFRSSAAGIQVQSIRMSIFPTGNVAIGTTTDAGYLLDVNGTGIFRDDLTVSKSGVSYINLVSTASNVVLKLNTPAYSSSYIGYNTNGNAPIEFYDYSVSATTFTLSPSTGAATLLSLAGSGTRMVVADGSGTLSTQSIPTGTVTGSGTTNYVSKWSSSSSLSNSLLYDNGTNVGIGTTSPAYLLDVAGTNRSTTFLSTNATSSTGLYITSAAPSSGGAVIRIVKDAPDKQVYQSFESDTLYFGVAANQTGLADIGTKGGVSLVLSTGYSERMRITSGGNVLINTTTDAGYKLDIAGTSRSDLHIFRSNQSAPTADAFIFRPADNTVALGTANTERMRVDSNGNVGIGTTTPYGDLEVTSKTRAWGEGIVVNPSSSGYEAIFFRVEGTSGSSYTGTWAIGKNAGSDPGGEVFQVVKNGLTGGALYRADAPQQWKANGDSIFGFKVGIGTTSPSAKLHIGESGAAAQLWLQRTDGYNPVKLIGGTLLDGNGFKITMNTIDSLAITSGGNVGIGNTAPNQKLELSVGNAVTGGIRINYSASATSEGMDITYLNTGSTVTSFDSRYNSSGAIMQFRMKTAATPVTAMTIFGSGNIAIGTTTDAGYKLDVSGTARIQSTLTVGSTGNSGTINLARASTGGTAGAIIQTNDVTQFYNYQGSGIDFYVAGASTVTRAFVRTTGIGITGTSGGNFTMDASAALQINSTIQGFLPPRMTSSQRTSISTPATGLVVYQTDGVEGLYVYTSSGWKALTMT